MIWWRGMGHWVIWIVGGVVLGSRVAFEALLPAASANGYGMPMGASLLLAAAACYPLGQFTRKRQGVVLDGEMALDAGHHSLFFVPVHFWTWVLGVIGIGLLVTELTR
jgi:hypothetical protein